MPDDWDNYVKKKKKKRNAANTLATFVNSSNTKLAILMTSFTKTSRLPLLVEFLALSQAELARL